ncbi:hypothetical protein [Cupriavidus sp. D39]|uniref:hypothetical protein n=1 Tax=Cupriavidus sp. D39 TaxID=2997877 RepID=UPI00226F7223|nr:hypothetical protein [Cupriavidus sp. D39]MCY0856644.1 hypothetical protein [Cupriavidus sp. D39]
MQLLVAMNFVADLDAITIERLDHLGYQAKLGDTVLDRFAVLYTHTERTIPPVPYELRFSDEIRQNPKFKTHRKPLEEIMSRLRRGESLRPYLSTRAVRAAYHDPLLLTWGIHHLHLNSIDTLDKRGFVERKRGESELLLLRIDGQTAYLIDIVAHDELDLFDNPRLLTVVDRNWPELHFAPKSVTSEVFTPQEIKALRSNRTNFAIQINGRTVLPKGELRRQGCRLKFMDGIGRLRTNCLMWKRMFAAASMNSSPIVPRRRKIGVQFMMSDSSESRTSILFFRSGRRSENVMPVASRRSSVRSPSTQFDSVVA